ncbi:hypothetical protein HHK36_008219 [Tetracentron sinense]|uniref:Uncharacterized protein n=1 Tax=Tetracentron sinense TaxID=13715 RepID=A0A834ZF30_TETSI|nr:hypothetical protein HHK36_008219 [Tetracentron sinense]
MASALLASRNEPCWEERKVYMRKNPNSKPKVRPNPNKIHHPSSQINGRHTAEPAAAAPAVSDFSSSLDHKLVGVKNPKDSFLGGCVTFNISDYSRRELKELKKRLISELEQVRNLSDRIDLREIQSRSGCSASQFSGSHGGREVTSSTRRPPPLHLDSPGADGLKEKRTPKANQYYRPSEFVMGKDKMPPPDNKKVSGSKRPLPFVPGRDPKRMASEPQPATGKLQSSAMKRCRQILTKVMKHKHGWIFNVPVDVVDMGLHDYNQIIKHPMDLGTVKLKLDKNLYRSLDDFASDVRLTFNNALIYNPKGHDVYVMAEQLLARFEEMFEPVSSEGTRRSSWIQIPTPENAKRPDPVPISKKPDSIPVRAPPAPMPLPAVKQLATAKLATGKQPKPKAKDPEKREMSFHEKQKLGMNLQSLPQEKMELVLEIVRKRNGNLSQDGDEIELDIEAVDTETLWELDRFVNNCKKLMSKIKRQPLTSNPTSSVEGNKKKQYLVSETPEAAKKNRKGETGEEDVDIGDEIPMNNFPPVEIEKDAGYASSGSSSSSSSSSDSSSSSGKLIWGLLGVAGSDSGSSSRSDSEGHSPKDSRRT